MKTITSLRDWKDAHGRTVESIKFDSPRVVIYFTDDTCLVLRPYHDHDEDEICLSHFDDVSGWAKTNHGIMTHAEAEEIRLQWIADQQAAKEKQEYDTYRSLYRRFKGVKPEPLPCECVYCQNNGPGSCAAVGI